VTARPLLGQAKLLALGLIALAIGWPTVSYAEA